MSERSRNRVKVLARVEKDKAECLRNAAEALYLGRDPTSYIRDYKRSIDSDRFVLDPSFGVAPVGPGMGFDGPPVDLSPRMFAPESSDYFVVGGHYIGEPDGEIPETIDDRIHLYSDPPIGPLACTTCLTSVAVETARDVSEKLELAKLHQHGLDGERVAIAIVDTGIYRPHLRKLLGEVDVDDELSWDPSTLATKAGMHRIGHGTMCAYNALIAAPKATLLDVPILIARSHADHSVRETVGAAMGAYRALVYKWVLAPILGKAPTPRVKTLVINNSWGIFHPSLDFPAGHRNRYIDNPRHIFRIYVSLLTAVGFDVVFAASNCGSECPSAVCLGQTEGMINGANAYPEVLTVAGSDTKDRRVGYSSRGPAIPGFGSQKPNLSAYTHFLGSKVRSGHRPDTGTSTACAVAAGCVAALRTRTPKQAASPAEMIRTLQETAHQVGPPGWNPDYGHGIIRPVKAAEKLGLIPG